LFSGDEIYSEQPLVKLGISVLLNMFVRP